MSSLLAVSRQAGEELRTQGFTVVRQLIPAEAFGKIEEIVTNDLVRHELTDGTLGECGQPRYISIPAGDSSTGLDLVEVNRSEHVEALFHHPNILVLITRLLGQETTDTVFMHPAKLLRGVPPSQSELHNPPGVHQDYPEFQGSPQQLTMWVPLFPVAEHSGALPVYSTSRTRLLPLILASNPSGWQVDPRFLTQIYIPQLVRGDAMIFSTFTPHGGSTNRGDGWRLSLECRFQPVQDCIAETNLVPLVGSSWDDHYQGWRTFPYYWTHNQPPTVPFDHSWERWRDMTALQEALRGNREAVVGLKIAREFSTDAQIRCDVDTVLREWEERGWL